MEKFITNMNHVEGMDSHAVAMDNGQQLYLQREAYQSLRKRYIAYYTGGLS